MQTNERTFDSFKIGSIIGMNGTDYEVTKKIEEEVKGSVQKTYTVIFSMRR